MKRVLVFSILKIISTLIIISTSLFGYINVNSKSIDKNLIKEEVVLTERQEAEGEVLQEESEEKIKEEVEESNVIENNTNYQTPITTGNSIVIPNILDKPLMKDENGEHFYLSHNINGVYDGVGVPFVDFRNDFNGKKTIIYAHSSMSGNGPFQVLQNYHNNKSFYDAHRYITVNYNGSSYTYEIFSVYVSIADGPDSEGLEYFRRMSYGSSDWQEAITKYKNNSEYDTGVSVSSNDRIIILQTCSMDPNYYERYYRYNLLIMGKLV